jgi:cbb3-type cytochrome oxidase maturation protein
MDILLILIPLSLVLVAFGCWAFFWAVDAGQFDDLDSPGWDVLRDDAADHSTSGTHGGESRT